MAEEKKKVIIDIDVIIEKYNAANPNERQLDRERLKDLLGMKNTQVFSDWKSIKKATPKWAGQLLILLDLGQCEVSDFILEKEDEAQKENKNA